MFFIPGYAPCNSRGMFFIPGYAPCNSRGMFFIPLELYPRYGIHTSVFAVHVPINGDRSVAREEWSNYRPVARAEQLQEIILICLVCRLQITSLKEVQMDNNCTHLYRGVSVSTRPLHPSSVRVWYRDYRGVCTK